MCCKVLGYYVSPEVWCQLVLPAIRTSGGCRVSGTDQASTVAVGPVHCTSCVRVLVGLLCDAIPDTLRPQLQVTCCAIRNTSFSNNLPQRTFYFKFESWPARLVGVHVRE